MKNNIYKNIPSELPEELFEVLAESDNVTIERIISKGHTTPKSSWYDQDKNEWVIVLKGSATITFENAPSVHLEEGDYVNILAHQKHRVDKTSSTPETVWLAIHY